MKKKNASRPKCDDCKWFVGPGPYSMAVVTGGGSCHYNPPTGGLWPSVTAECIGCSKHEKG